MSVGAGPGELVLQFRGTRVETEDELVEIEDALVEMLCNGDAWAGREVTPSARSIVIDTRDATATFARLLPFLERAGLTASLTAGGRAHGQPEFVGLWPAGQRFFR